EVTHGAHGWHPHLHLLILTTEWSSVERDVLLRAWCAAVDREAERLGIDRARVRPDAAITLRWSSARASRMAMERSQYLAKLGWEMSGIGKGEGQWALAARAADGDPGAIQAWRE